MHKRLYDIVFVGNETRHFIAGKGDFFYDACLKLTEKYQRTGDKAKVHIAVGSLFTNTKVNNYIPTPTIPVRNNKKINIKLPT